MSHPADPSPTERHRAARHAVDELGQARDDHALLRVRCGRSHHVATIFDTAIGAVYESSVGPHAHGHRDFVDEAHHAAHHGTRYVDMLDSDILAEDLVPAYCECGSYELSRNEMRRAIDEGRHTIQLS
ncbi:alpha/beta hydrolase family protein [Nocardia aurantiaca]|uniref:Uncharacterized protein n=1 Tax=Nocardia aurantiaca TaxID=2675850 RepID=A0A6I3L4U2_9NOCA|nr:hypothetical protein [Nocardia aurantiaca]MTE16867.1 hypothetical protein [Nocardia aurantiaca]